MPIYTTSFSIAAILDAAFIIIPMISAVVKLHGTRTNEFEKILHQLDGKMKHENALRSSISNKKKYLLRNL